MSGASFFSRIRSHIIDNSDKDPEGRYFSICLAEVLNKNRNLLELIFKQDSFCDAGIEISTEYSFFPYGAHNDYSRRADIAILDKADFVKAFIEVKCADAFLEGQIEDYIHFAKRKKIHLLFLTRYELLSTEKRMLDLSGVTYTTLTIAQLLPLLSNYEKKDSLSKLLLDYIKENEMAFNRYIPSGLNFFLTRIFFIDSQELKASRSMVIDDMPDAIRAVCSNVYFLADALINRMSLRNKEPRPTINFWVNPCIPRAELKRLLLQSQKKKRTTIYDKFEKGGGYLWFESTITLSQTGKTNDWCALYVGAVAEILRKGNSFKQSLCLYSQFQPDRLDDSSYCESVSFKFYMNSGRWDMGDERSALKILIDCIRQSKKDYICTYSKKSSRKKHAREYGHLPLIRHVSIH